ncbi:MAG: hypothetical protein ABIY50_04925 [Ignavibacteria bacterium]
MKIFKALIAMLFVSLYLLQPNVSHSNTGTGNKSAELNSQIIQEVKEVLKNPYLKYESKNLSGEVSVTTSVDKNGKIIFKDIKGINENLLSNVIAKLNSLNLWTSPDYSGKNYNYKIKYKN